MNDKYDLNKITTIVSNQLISMKQEYDMCKKLSKYTNVYSFPTTEYLGDLMITLEELLLNNDALFLEETIDLYYWLCFSFNREPLFKRNRKNEYIK